MYIEKKVKLFIKQKRPKLKKNFNRICIFLFIFNCLLNNKLEAQINYTLKKDENRGCWYLLANNKITDTLYCSGAFENSDAQLYGDIIFQYSKLLKINLFIYEYRIKNGIIQPCNKGRIIFKDCVRLYDIRIKLGETVVKWRHKKTGRRCKGKELYRVILDRVYYAECKDCKNEDWIGDEEDY